MSNVHTMFVYFYFNDCCHYLVIPLFCTNIRGKSDHWLFHFLIYNQYVVKTDKVETADMI